MTYKKIEVPIGPDKIVTLETGKIAKQAGGSVIASLGNTMVLVTACIGKEMESDFFPLTVEYREKSYAAGKFPGGYLKRESKLSDKEVLVSRIIDRTIRPLFPAGFRNEVQVIAMVINSDDIYDAETVAVGGASAALGLSSIPFDKQVASVRVVRVDGEFIVNPTYAERAQSDVEMVVSGSEDSIVMVEGGAYEMSEEDTVNAIMKGHETIKMMVEGQNKLMEGLAKPKNEFVKPEPDSGLVKKVEALCVQKLKDTLHIPMVKMPHYEAMNKIRQSVLDALVEEYPGKEGEIKEIFGNIEKREMREMILSEQIRIDGRKMNEVRPIEIELGLLPNAHGSALFQRGETQGMVVITLGTKRDEQRVDSLHGDSWKNYYLHYNFPPYCVGETKKMMGPGRREIGHGNLAERALEPVLPTAESFSYTIRIVSEIMESNGSSSMASVCGGSLALMNGGVPVKTAVSGIAMGLISDGERMEVLSDITGTEDHLGDMDFKVCGTQDGITAFQMDIKIKGITSELMLKALNQAKEGRLHILGKMNEAIAVPNPLSSNAPCIMKRKIPEDKIKDLIGPGGKVIRGIQEVTAVNIDVDDSGEVVITGPNKGNTLKAMEMVDSIFKDVEVGMMYTGRVKNITNFGIFVEVLPGKEGLVHISELNVERGAKLENSFKFGDELPVKCIGVDPHGKVRLSAKQTD